MNRYIKEDPDNPRSGRMFMRNMSRREREEALRRCLSTRGRRLSKNKKFIVSDGPMKFRYDIADTVVVYQPVPSLIEGGTRDHRELFYASLEEYFKKLSFAVRNGKNGPVRHLEILGRHADLYKGRHPLDVSVQKCRDGDVPFWIAQAKKEAPEKQPGDKGPSVQKEGDGSPEKGRPSGRAPDDRRGSRPARGRR
jgi:hypothetical protein